MHKFLKVNNSFIALDAIESISIGDTRIIIQKKGDDAMVYLIDPSISPIYKTNISTFIVEL